MGDMLYEAKFNFDPIFLVPVIMFAATFLVPKAVKKQNENADVKFMKGFCVFARIFIAVLVTFAAVMQFNMYKKTVYAYRNGNYSVVEGAVENFVPMPYSGHGDESFEINGVKFHYSDYSIVQGYNRSRAHGGFIEGNGQRLRIGYVYYNNVYGNIIVCIEQL